MTNFEKGFFIMAFLTLGLLASACDPCADNAYKQREREIYFTAMPMNYNISLIAGCMSDGTKMLEIDSNSSLFSSPQGSNISFITVDTNGKKLLAFYNIYTNKYVPVIYESPNFKIEYPVLSPKGSFTAFYSGSGSYMIAKNDGTFSKQKSGNYCEHTLGAFSPDEQYLAFYEQDVSNGKIIFKIVDTSQANNVLANISFDAVPFDTILNESPCWAANSKDVYFTIQTTDSTDNIYKYNIILNSFSEVSISLNSKFSPKISPDGTKLIFCSIDGSIYMKNSSDNDTSLVNIIPSSNGNRNLFPDWSPDSKKLIYTNYKLNNGDIFSGILELYDINKKNSIILADNIYRAFWKR